MHKWDLNEVQTIPKSIGSIASVPQIDRVLRSRGFHTFNCSVDSQHRTWLGVAGCSWVRQGHRGRILKFLLMWNGVIQFGKL